MSETSEQRTPSEPTEHDASDVRPVTEMSSDEIEEELRNDFLIGFRKLALVSMMLVACVILALVIDRHGSVLQIIYFPLAFAALVATNFLVTLIAFTLSSSNPKLAEQIQNGLHRANLFVPIEQERFELLVEESRIRSRNEDAYVRQPYPSDDNKVVWLSIRRILKVDVRVLVLVLGAGLGLVVTLLKTLRTPW